MSPVFDVRAVLFDLDGPLIDSAPDLGAVADQMRTDRGYPSLPPEAYRPKAGAGAGGRVGAGCRSDREGGGEFKLTKDKVIWGNGVNWLKVMAVVGRDGGCSR